MTDRYTHGVGGSETTKARYQSELPEYRHGDSKPLGRLRALALERRFSYPCAKSVGFVAGHIAWPWSADRGGIVMTMATAREQLHDIVERMSEDEARDALERLAVTSDDPVLRSFLSAPEEDEEISADEDNAVQLGQAGVRGRQMVSHDEVRRRNG
jgi:hypothetical protein